MNYIVYCEWYGHKKKITVMAGSATKAKKVVEDNLVFHKIIKSDKVTETNNKVFSKDEVVKNLMDMFEMK